MVLSTPFSLFFSCHICVQLRLICFYVTRAASESLIFSALVTLLDISRCAYVSAVMVIVLCSSHAWTFFISSFTGNKDIGFMMTNPITSQNFMDNNGELYWKVNMCNFISFQPGDSARYAYYYDFQVDETITKSPRVGAFERGGILQLINYPRLFTSGLSVRPTR